MLEAVVVFIGRRGGLDIEVEADRGAVAERRRVDHVVGVDGDPERLQADRPLLDRCLAHEVRPDAGCSELERVGDQRQFVVEDDDGILTLFVHDGEKPGRASAGPNRHAQKPGDRLPLVDPLDVDRVVEVLVGFARIEKVRLDHSDPSRGSATTVVPASRSCTPRPLAGRTTLTTSTRRKVPPTAPKATGPP